MIQRTLSPFETFHIPGPGCSPLTRTVSRTAVAGLGVTVGAAYVELVGCANAAVDASALIKQTRKFENMRKVNPLVVSIVLLRHVCLAIGSSLAI
jgi:hypothetical protein